eukprot:7036156-Pyramimonas_sp.AAC.1
MRLMVHLSQVRGRLNVVASRQSMLARMGRCLSTSRSTRARFSWRRRPESWRPGWDNFRIGRGMQAGTGCGQQR